MTNQFAGRRPHLALAVIALAITAMAFPAHSDAGTHRPLLRESSCDTGSACFWSLDEYGGADVSYDGTDACCVWRDVDGGADYHSAKNRTSSRKLQLGTASSVVACLDPGENRPDPGAYERFKVGGIGSGC